LEPSDAENRIIDLHLFEFAENGALCFENETFPSDILSGEVTIGDITVRCLTAEAQVRYHQGYEQKEKDRHDVLLLCKKFGFAVPVFLFLFCVCATSNGDFHFQTGDLLFQAGNSSELNGAIAGATFGENNIHYTHAGIVSVEKDTVFVIEATPPVVCKTLLDTFLLRSATLAGKPVVAVGRLKPEYRKIIPQSVVRAKKLLGKPYDYIYSPDNDAYYCSELIMLSYLNSQNMPIFEPVSMNFRDDNGNLPAYWIEHFEKYNATIPENCPGSNPGDLSRSDKIEIVYRFFEIE